MANPRISQKLTLQTAWSPLCRSDRRYLWSYWVLTRRAQPRQIKTFMIHQTNPRSIPITPLNTAAVKSLTFTDNLEWPHIFFSSKQIILFLCPGIHLDIGIGKITNCPARQPEKTFCVWQPQVCSDNYIFKKSEGEWHLDKRFYLVNSENFLNLFTVNIPWRRLVSLL